MLLKHPLKVLIGLYATTGCASTETHSASLLSAALPAIVCLQLNSTLAPAIDTGATRLQIDIRNQVAIKRYNGEFIVNLLESDGGRTAIGTFAMQPDQQKGNQVQKQSFQFSLAAIKLTPNKANAVCFELSRNSLPAPADDAILRDITLSWRSF